MLHGVILLVIMSAAHVSNLAGDVSLNMLFLMQLSPRLAVLFMLQSSVLFTIQSNAASLQGNVVCSSSYSMLKLWLNACSKLFLLRVASGVN